MFPSEYQNEQYRRDLLKEAENRALIKLATADSPSLWQRVTDRLPNVEITAPSVRVVAKRPVEVIA
jgi:hypothetical protein